MDSRSRPRIRIPWRAHTPILLKALCVLWVYQIYVDGGQHTVYICIYIYIYKYLHQHMYMYIYSYVWTGRFAYMYVRIMPCHYADTEPVRIKSQCHRFISARPRWPGDLATDLRGFARQALDCSMPLTAPDAT